MPLTGRCRSNLIFRRYRHPDGNAGQGKRDGRVQMTAMKDRENSRDTKRFGK